MLIAIEVSVVIHHLINDEECSKTCSILYNLNKFQTDALFNFNNLSVIFTMWWIDCAWKQSALTFDS